MICGAPELRCAVSSMSEQARRGNVRWFLVFWLFILSAVSFLDRVNISVAGSAIASEYHLSHIQLGWVFSAFLWGYAFFQTFGGWLADRLGPRRVLTAGVVWWGIFTALTAAVSPAIAGAVFLFVLVRFLLGAGEAIIFPASNQFISRWIPTQERGIANGLIFAGVGAGAGSAPAIVTYIMVHYGWRWSFWLSALIGLLVGLVWFLAARDTPGEAPKCFRSRIAAHPKGRDAGKSSAPDSNSRPIPWSVILSQQGSLARHPELLLFRICRMDFLQLVLHLPRQGSRPGSESQRFLQHVSAPGHGCLQPFGRRHQ